MVEWPRLIVNEGQMRVNDFGQWTLHYVEIVICHSLISGDVQVQIVIYRTGK
jgi:hypothetical protein